MTDSFPRYEDAPDASGAPEDIQEELRTLEELARPLKAPWRGNYRAVFSCGVDGRVFRPVGVGRPQDEKLDEDLRNASSLLREVSDQLQSIRPDGGRFYLREEGAFTWDRDRQELVCFLEFPERRGGASQAASDPGPSTAAPGGQTQSSDGEIERARSRGEPLSEDEFEDRITEITGIGPVAARSLWRHGYRELQDLEEASVDELSRTPWLSLNTAREIKSALSELSPTSRQERAVSTQSSTAHGQRRDPERVQNTSLQDFDQPYSIFQADPLEQLRIETIRARAARLRTRVQQQSFPSNERFSSDIYRFETETKIDDRDLTGALFNPWISIPDSLIRELRTALDQERATLSGNYLWGGDYDFGEGLDAEDDPSWTIEQSFLLLGLSTTPPLEKAERIADLPGLGPVSASGLVTMCHPDGFTLYYKQPYEMMGVDIDSLADLSEWLPTIRTELGVEDGVELARFVRLLQEGGFEMMLRRFHERP